MYDTTIAFKAHKQLRRFPGRISPHFSKPTAAFVGDALFGIQASGEVKLRLVVVRGFGRHPMILLTNLAERNTRESLEQAVDGYISRWRVEDTIRYVKQAYKLEDVRLMFARHGRWTRYSPDEPSPQLEFALDWGWRRNGGLRRERRFRHVMEERMCALRGCAPCSRRNPERARRFDRREAGNTRAR